MHPHHNSAAFLTMVVFSISFLQRSIRRIEWFLQRLCASPTDRSSLTADHDLLLEPVVSWAGEAMLVMVSILRGCTRNQKWEVRSTGEDPHLWCPALQP